MLYEEWRSWHEHCRCCRKHEFTVLLNIQYIDIGCTYLILVILLYYFWGMSTFLDSVVKVVWQTRRKRECNRVQINAISQIQINENDSYCKAESDLSSTCWQLCPWVDCMGKSPSQGTTKLLLLLEEPYIFFFTDNTDMTEWIISLNEENTKIACFTSSLTALIHVSQILERKGRLYKCKYSPLMTIDCISKGLDWGIEVGEQKISRASSPTNNQLWASY